MNFAQLAALRIWFLIHFVIDLIFGLPLLFAPRWFLPIFDFPTENLLFARLVGAALFAIGMISLFARESSRETFQTLLAFKILWSSAAILGLIISIHEGAPKSTWLFLGIFVLFFFVWNYWKRALENMDKKLP